MPEGLQTLDGETIPLDSVKIDKEFAQAMSAPVDEPPAPPKRPETLSGDKESTRKRPPKTQRSRVQAPKAADKPSPELDAQRSDGIKGLVQMAAVGCLMADQRTDDSNIAFKADAVALSNSADALASACVDTAKANPGFARLIDKVTQVGPYAALVGVTMGLAAQLAANHGIAAGKMLGGKDPEEVLKDLEPDADTTA